MAHASVIIALVQFLVVHKLNKIRKSAANDFCSLKYILR